MAKKFEYVGPEVIENCRECLYRQFSSEEQQLCFHPKNTEHEYVELSGDYHPPKWCPHPEVKNG
jgi:hypothetical protein